jgi:hypothetical protein
MIEHIIVSDSSAKASESTALIQSNVRVINEFLRNFVQREELCVEALKSYYVNLYLLHMSNGGFAEFVYRTGWEQMAIKHLVAGLESLGAEAHIELLGRFAERLSTFGADGIQCLYDDEHPQNQQMRDFLNEFMPEFLALNHTENLTSLNGDWLKGHAKLVVMSETDIKKQIEVAAKAIPNRMKRIAEALEKEPRHMKLIRLLCSSANLDYIDLTPQYRVQPIIKTGATIWHFDTVQGAYYLADSLNEASIFDVNNHAEIASVQIEEVERSSTAVH